MSREITIKKTIYKFEELPKEAKEKAIEQHADINVDYEWWDFDGLLDLSSKEMRERKIYLGDYPASGLFKYDKMYFDLDAGRAYINFSRLIVNDEEVFRRFLRIPKKLWVKTYYAFVDEYKGSTSIEFSENDFLYEFTEKQKDSLDMAKQIFDDKVSEAWTMLWKEYECRTTAEAIAETLTINEYEFDLDGNIVTGV